jgi:DNA polymerase-3 subunit delta'
MDLFGDTQDDVIYDDDVPADVGFECNETSEGRLCEPTSMSFCLGHEAQEALFIDLFKKNSMPHAMIFSGLEGIGKTTMAFRLARFLFKHGKVNSNDDHGGLFGKEAEVLPHEINSLDVDPSDPVFRLIASGGHPDFLHIRRLFDKSKGRQDAGLKVETIREVEPFLRKTASEGGWRVVIVEDADTMNRNAQNAILKILEEPPANVLIMLIAHRPGLLIPTIHSRSRNIQFTPLSAMIMEVLLARKEGISKLSLSDVETLSDLSEGSVGQAIRFIEQDGLNMLQKILEHIQYAIEEKHHIIHEFSGSIAKSTQDTQYRIFTYAFLWILRKLLFAKARGYNEVSAYIRNDATQSLLNDSHLEKLITLNDDIKKVFESVDFSNLDRRDAVRSAFLMISQ